MRSTLFSVILRLCSSYATFDVPSDCLALTRGLPTSVATTWADEGRNTCDSCPSPTTEESCVVSVKEPDIVEAAMPASAPV